MKVCLMCRCRNERNIKEWIKYHLTIGFSTIFIYDDFSEPSIESQLVDECLSDVYIVRREDRVPIHPYRGGWAKGYQDIFAKIKELDMDFDYIMDLDVDEYLYLGSDRWALKKHPEYNTVQEMLRAYEPFDILLLNWLMIGNSGKVRRKSDSVLNTFDRSSNRYSTNGKSIANFKSIDRAKVSPHLFEYFIKPTDQIIVKNALKQIIPNKIPIAHTEMFSQMISLRPYENKKSKKKSKRNKNPKADQSPNTQKDLEFHRSRPCVFHYCVQDIETYLKAKINNKRCRLFPTEKNPKGEYLEVFPYSDEEVKYKISKIKNEADFLNRLEKDGFEDVLEYYKINNFNKVRNRLLYNKFNF